MTRGETVRALFTDAIGVPADDRDAFLDRRCAGDPDLRREVAALLEHHDRRPRSYMATPLVDVGGHGGPRAGTSVAGRYTLERVLGEGGMGVVWLAQQESPRREVAIKLIQPGLAGRDLLRRFELEAAALGRLSHPGIAQIHEAGTFDDGAGVRPFFAMELVHGAPLMEFVRERGLDTRSRLALFTRICDAVHHAHLKGVIHRDLKPGNILVTDGAGEAGRDGAKEETIGQPKVLDFGVARVTDSDVQVTTMRTDVGKLIGTLAYMSPEQIEGQAGRIDARSDVYALGVILFELLAERLPHDLEGLSIAHAARVITEEDAAPLGSVVRAHRGDLDTIVQKALEHDPDRRYPSSADLGADVRRYLDDQPIVARRTTTAYQLRKFAKRNKALVGGLTAAVLALTLGLVGTTVGMLRARESGQRALAMNAFMQDILVAADVDEGQADIRLVEVLRQASDRASNLLAAHPGLEADVRDLLGSSFLRLSLFDEAATHLQRAVEFRRANPGLDDPVARATAHRYVQTLVELLRFDDASALADEILALAPARDAGSPVVLDLRNLKARMMGGRGQHDAAEAALRDLLVDARASLGPDHDITLRAAARLARHLRDRLLRGERRVGRSDLDEADALNRDTLSRQRRIHGEDARLTLYLMADRVEILRRRGSLDDAAAIAEDVFDRAVRRYGADHDVSDQLRTILAMTRHDRGEYVEAAELLVAAVESRTRRLGGDSLAVLAAMADALPSLVAADRAKLGASYARTVYERFRDMGSGAASAALEYRLFLAHLLSRLGQFEEAESHFAAILEAEVEAEGNATGDFPHRQLDVFLGAHLAARGGSAEAEARLRAALEGHEADAGDWLTVVAQRALLALRDPDALP